MPRAPFSRPPVPGEARCVKCGSTNDLRPAEFHQNVGVLVVRVSKIEKGLMCPRCVVGSFWSCTLTTFFFGWWGFISFLMTPCILLANWINFARAYPPRRGTILVVPVMLLCAGVSAIYWVSTRPPPPQPLTFELARQILADAKPTPEARAVWDAAVAQARATARDPMAKAVAHHADPKVRIELLVDVQNEIPRWSPSIEGHQLIRESAFRNFGEELRRPFPGKRFVGSRLVEQPGKGPTATLRLRLLPDGDPPRVRVEGELTLDPGVRLKGEAAGRTTPAHEIMRKNLGLEILGPDYGSAADLAIDALFKSWR